MQFLIKLSKYLSSSQVFIVKKQRASIVEFVRYKIELYRALKQCRKQFKDFRKDNYENQIEVMYYQLRQASSLNDRVLAFKYLSYTQYLVWKQKGPFNVYQLDDVAKLQLIRGRKIKQQDGQWFQFAVRFTHVSKNSSAPFYKTHIIERKVNQPYGVDRKWYFCYFQN